MTHPQYESSSLNFFKIVLYLVNIMSKVVLEIVFLTAINFATNGYVK